MQKAVRPWPVVLAVLVLLVGCGSDKDGSHTIDPTGRYGYHQCEGLQHEGGDDQYVATESEVRNVTTGLVWQRVRDRTAYHLFEAKVLCAEAGLRLPTVEELFRLGAFLCANADSVESLFPNGEIWIDGYWSSTPASDNPDDAYSIAFYPGRFEVDMLAERLGYRNMYRCVH